MTRAGRRVRGDVLRRRDFRLLLAGYGTSSFGDRLVPVALAFAVLDLTGSPSDLGFVLACATVPTLALVAFGGVWADRLPRRLVMVAADLLRAGSQGVAGALLVFHQAQIWEIAVLQAVYGAATAFFTPALTGFVPAVVAPAELPAANAVLSLARSATGIAGPAAAGVLVVALNPGAALLGDAATFCVSALCLALTRPRLAPRAVAATSVFRDLREGLREIRTRTWLWVMIGYFGVFNVAAFPALLVLGPYVAKHSLGGAGAWALILTIGSVGSLLGSLVALHVRPSHPLRVGELACLTAAMPMALLAIPAPAAAVGIALLLARAGTTASDALWQTVLQQRVPEAALSRVSAIDWTGTLVFNPLGFAVVGPLAAVVGVRATLLAAAALTAAATISALSVPSVRQLRDLSRAGPEPSAL
jgi:MFS family permease